MIPPCLTLSIIRYVSRIKWRVAPSPTPWCSSYWKGSLQLTLAYGCQLYLLILFHGSQSDSKSQQFSRILLSILADVSTFVLMVSILPTIFSSSCPFCRFLRTVPRASTKIAIIVTFTFYSFSAFWQGPFICLVFRFLSL